MKLTDILPEPVSFCVYRYGHLYVIQGSAVLVLDKDRNLERTDLGFCPTTWASFSGTVVLYAPGSGAAQFSGSELVAEHHGGSERYSAPLASPRLGNEGIFSPPTVPGPDINGLPIVRHGSVVRSELISRSFYSEPTGALIEEGRVLLFLPIKAGFGFLNGVQGDLLYGEPPKLTVPYSYAEQGLFGAGTPDGYVFSPDLGRSWRYRFLGGWGVLTEAGILRVTPEQGIEVVVGR